MENLTAAQARQIARIDLPRILSPSTNHFICAFNYQIRQIAETGGSLFNISAYLKMREIPGPRGVQWDEIKLHYTSKGFRWNEYPGPDHDLPNTDSYVTLTW